MPVPIVSRIRERLDFAANRKYRGGFPVAASRTIEDTRWARNRRTHSLSSQRENSEKRQLGPFQLEGRLGAGGMGIVYRATYLKTGQSVAVKVLAPDLTADPKIAKRFEREMSILKKLQHPHIIRYFGGSTSGAQRYYAMEMLTGGALDEVLRKKGNFSWEQAVEYGLQIAKALEHAHNAGVIHRDLKPANLLLTKKGILKLTDFGIARDTQATQITAAGKTVGTMAYMAPEQITGKVPVSRKTDLYALGCVLFQMLTGRTPFESETSPEMLFKHIDEEPPAVREFNIDCPIWLDRLIAELLEKEPDERPFDALAVQVKLEEVKQKVNEQESIVQQTVAGGRSALTMRDGDPTITRMTGARRKKRKKKRDQAAFYEKAWFLALCLCGIVALFTWALWPDSEQEIYDRVASILDSPDPNDWFEAKPDIETLLRRFPDGPHAEKAQGWLDLIEAERLVNRIKTRIRLGHDPENNLERDYRRARNYEELGHNATALAIFEDMQEQLVGAEGSERVYLVLARRESERIRPLLSDEERSPAAFLRNLLTEADGHYRDGQPTTAREKWEIIVDLYSGQSEYDEFVEQARDRLADPETALDE